MAHTPGPWAVGGARETCVVPLKEPDQRICVCWFPRIDENHAYSADEEAAMLPELQANARLIAAAPELLAALKLLRDPDGDGEWPCYCDDPHFEGGRCENCVATAAIAKAEGRE